MISTLRRPFLSTLALVFGTLLYGQHMSDFVGAGHFQNMKVATSHNDAGAKPGQSTFDGFAVDDVPLLSDASRFLAQTTLGYDYEMVEQVAAMGHEAWLDEQLSLPRISVVDIIEKIENNTRRDPEILWGMYQFRAAWWDLVLKQPDVFRNRITYTLSQIFVVSAFGSDEFEDFNLATAAYYDLLGQYAFSNFRDLLRAVSLNASMGLYLSHANNPKSDPANNVHPDENYAREIMQLFSIGLFELNLDGSHQLDSAGTPIPTYGQDDIREFAKVFTGLGDGRPGGEWDSFEGEEDEMKLTATLPMRMYEEWHEPGEKHLLNGLVVPAGQTGMQDIEMAIDNLFYHPNVGPFMGKKLIQFLVMANPSPDYVERVASVFNDNGQGIRGDLKAVYKAILLDPEARNCNAAQDPFSGKLREPIVRYTGVVRAFNAQPDNKQKIFVTVMDQWEQNTGQVPLYSTSVFNFYSPEYSPPGPVGDLGLVAPVFQIHNSSTSIGFINQVDEWVFDDRYLYDEVFEEDRRNRIKPGVTLNFSDELALADQPEELVQRLNILLACGQLSARSQSIIANAISELKDEDERVKMALYLILISPEYAVLK